MKSCLRLQEAEGNHTEGGLEKAYHKVRWNFLEGVMQKKGSRKEWI
jgi:hypothetical protein